MIARDQKKMVGLGYSAWIDADTNLMWEVKSNDNFKFVYVWRKKYVANVAESSLEWMEDEVKDCDSYIERMNTVGYAGYNDWRLPTIDELKTLLHRSGDGTVNVKLPLQGNCMRGTWSDTPAIAVHVYKVTGDWRNEAYIPSILTLDLSTMSAASYAPGNTCWIRAVRNATENSMTGLNDIAKNITQGVNSRIGSKKIALQFILEELDAAREGNEAATQFVTNSGFDPSEYEGAMQNSIGEVDGPNGPQQFLVSSIMRYSSDMDFMVNLRIKIVESIISDWGLNAYSEGRIDNLLLSLRKILEDDESVMPALTPNIQAPTTAKSRHISFRKKNIDSAKRIANKLSEITGDGVDKIIKNALNRASDD